MTGGDLVVTLSTARSRDPGGQLRGANSVPVAVTQGNAAYVEATGGDGEHQSTAGGNLQKR